MAGSRTWRGLALLGWRLAPPLAVVTLMSAARAEWMAAPLPAWLADWIDEPAAHNVGVVLTALVWIAAGWLLNRLVDLVLWRVLTARAGVPKMLTDLVALLIWAAVFLAMAQNVFHRSPTAIVATSTVALGVVGFAVRELISDFFAGIALSIEKPFAIGDWIEVDGIAGRVVDMNWRAVRLTTTDDVTIIVPNGNIAAETFRNYSRPTPWFRDEIRVPLPADMSPEQGERLLIGAVTQIPELAAHNRKPSVSIADYADGGVTWRLLYWAPDFGRLSSLRFAVHANVLRNLRLAGATVPAPAHDVRLSRPSGTAGAPLTHLLKTLPLFAPLAEAELTLLTAAATQRLVADGTVILRQGDPGSSLFLLTEGLARVTMTDAGGAVAIVGQIAPGQVFGEMSLLTGAPRVATVTAAMDCVVTEIGKDAMAELLTQRPEVAERLSRILVARQDQTASRTADRQGLDPETPVRQMLGRIRAFFNLPG